jgi:hypothetical protein
MNANPLLSCRVKISRAHKHFHDFQREIEKFSARNPNPIFTDENSEPAIKIDRFQIREDIPPDFSAYIGDIAHNLVSALDSLAMALVKFANRVTITEEVMRDTYFPINWESGLTDSKSQRILERVGPRAKQLILRLQPYKGGKGDCLFRLWRINVIDKHRSIVPVAANLAGVTFTLPEGGPPLPPREGARRPMFPLKHGDELSRRAFFEPEYNANAHFTLQIAFGQGEVFEGESVPAILETFIYLVERIIDIFSRHIFRCAW